MKKLKMLVVWFLGAKITFAGCGMCAWKAAVFIAAIAGVILACEVPLDPLCPLAMIAMMDAEAEMLSECEGCC